MIDATTFYTARGAYRTSILCFKVGGEEREKSSLYMAASRPLSRSLITFGTNSRVLPISTLISRGTYLFNNSDSQIRMSSTQENRAGATYSTTDTGDKPADPYKEVNSDVDASIKEKVEDLIAFVEGVKFGLMTTRQSQSGLLVSRCMSLVARENGIDFLFHTNTETGKTDELHSDPHVNLGFLKNSTGEWASISGIAAIDTDREKVRQHYTPALKAWVGDLGDKTHGGDPKDPRLAVIKVHAKTATYSLQKGTALSRGLEIAKESIIGNVANTSKLRELTEEELQTFRNSQQLIS